MKANKLMIFTVLFFTLFAFACGNAGKENHVHTEGDGHDHSAMVENQGQIKSNDRNEKGELIDAQGKLIMGCPGHKDMVGSAGDKCPKCGDMVMVPITWSIEGIDTVRVTTLAKN